MKAFVYILFSDNLEKFYTGFTTLVEERPENHIEKKYGKLNFFPGSRGLGIVSFHPLNVLISLRQGILRCISKK